MVAIVIKNEDSIVNKTISEKGDFYKYFAMFHIFFIVEGAFFIDNLTSL